VSASNGAAPPTLAGRRALVTGAASGIGLAIARRLAADGAAVVLSDRAGEALEAAALELAAEAVAADLTVREDVARLLEAAGPVEILVNNAGLQHVDALPDFPAEEWDRLLAVMLTAPFLLVQGTLLHMYEAEWGRIVNVASVHGLVASPFKAAYVSAKHGLIGLTKTIALEAAAVCPDVTAHAICPSYVRTPLVEAQIESQASAHGITASAVVQDVLLERNAVKRLIEPEQVAELVGYVCGPAAWTTTGAVFSMDAGWLAH
jgi:3-hydroxybutyrate dehydrogenase